MKKLLSILLALAMMLSLLGVAALADGEAEEVESEESAETVSAEEAAAPAVIILVTGEVALPADAESAPALDYASAAALKAHYAESGSVMLVDAGGFDAAAAAVMEAAGYDMAVTGESIQSETMVALAPVVDSAAGAIVNKGELNVAFIGINVPEVEETEESDETDPNAALYGVIQDSVDKAAEKADYVILLGLCADVQTLAENITGVDAILTTGDGVKTIEEENETTLVVGVGADFASIGVVTIDGEGVAAELLDAEAYAELELTEDESLQTMVASWIEEGNKPVEEEPEETQQPEEPEQSEIVVPTPAVTPATTPADDGEDTVDGEDEAPVVDGDETTGDETTGDETTGDETTGDETTGDETTGDETTGDETTGDETTGDETTGDETTGDETTGDETTGDETTGDETTGDETTGDEVTTINWSKGTEDLVLTFEYRVSELKLANPLVEGTDYTVSGDGNNTVNVFATMLNGWDNGVYEFIAVHPDGSTSSQRVSISGDYVAPTNTPDPTQEPTPTPTQEPEQDEVTVLNWSKGTQDLKITFENRVSQLKAGGNTLVEGSDYTVTDEGNTVTILSSMLNGWPNAKYAVTAVYPDGSQDTVYVSISGEYSAPAEEEDTSGEETAPTATPKATETPSGTPNTGDDAPILMYVIILVVLVIALVVVLVMTGKKNKKK